MTKQEIVKQAHLYMEGEHDPKTIAYYFDCLLKVMAHSLKQKQDITIREFGTFKVVESAERIGRHFNDKEFVFIPKKYRVRFIPSESIKTSLSEAAV